MMGKLEKMEVDPHGAAEGRPGRYVHHGALMRRVFNPVMVLVGSSAVLFVRGRKSGRRLAVPMDPPFEWRGRDTSCRPLATLTGPATSVRPARAS